MDVFVSCLENIAVSYCGRTVWIKLNGALSQQSAQRADMSRDVLYESWKQYHYVYKIILQHFIQIDSCGPFYQHRLRWIPTKK